MGHFLDNLNENEKLALGEGSMEDFGSIVDEQVHFRKKILNISFVICIALC